MEAGKSIVIILGMHRSGTSLFANWLYRCGFEIGEQLENSTLGNQKGQFEDIKFYSVHERILKKNGLNYKVFPGDKVKVDESDKQNIRDLINEKTSRYDQWGWKDPRTCLFLDTYQELIPDAKVIVLYRNYYKVVDSLVRRFVKSEKRFNRRNKLASFFNVYIKYKFFKHLSGNPWLKTWIRYNQDILNFLKQKEEENYLVVDADKFLEQDKEVFELIKKRFNLNIHYYPLNKIFDSTIYKKETEIYRFDKGLENIAKDLDKEFKSYRTKK